MTTFQSLPQAIPLDFELSELFSGVTSIINGLGLDELLSDAQQEIDKVKADLAQLKQIIDALGDINEQDKWYEKVNASFTVLDKVLVLLQNTSTAQYQAVVNSSEYKALIAFRKEWDVWAKPIGNQTESINETLEFDESKDSGNLLDQYKDVEFSIGLSVEGSAGFNLATFDKTDAKEATSFDIADGHTIVNQEVSAVIEATVNAAGSYQALTLSASANGKAKVEVDSFYQAASSTPTFEVLYNMYKKPLLPWSLANIADAMTLSEGDSAGAGYRGLSMIREASFGFEGEIGVGRSINSISNIDNQPVEIDVSAALSLSGKMAIDGKMELFTKRNKQNEIVLSVNTLDNQFKGKAVKLDIGTKIKGLDKVVQPQIERLIGKGNEVLKLLEENLDPGKRLVEKLLSEVDDDKWAKPIAKVLLGEEDLDAAIKKTIGDEIEKEFDQTVFSDEQNADELAEELMVKLIANFVPQDVSDTPLEGIAGDIIQQAKDQATQFFKEQIENIQAQATEAVDKLNSKIQNRAVEELAPLSKLGGDIGEIVTKVDTEAKALFDKLSKHYKTFSDKLKKAAAKSANIQLGLQYESANDVTESEEESFTIVFKKPEVKSAGKLYRSIIVGDDDTAATLIPELVKKGVIDFQAHSFSLQTLRNSRVSLGINVIGYNLNDNKNLVSDLVIKVGPDGKLNLIHKSVLSAVSKGPNKARSAMFNLSYAFAASALDPKVSSAVSLSYTNEDFDLHTQKEMKGILDSLALTNIDKNLRGQNLLPVISTKEAKTALAQYKNYTSTNGASTTKYLSSKSTSQLAINTRASTEVLDKMASLQRDSLFERALKCLMYSDRGSIRVGRRYIDNTYCFEDVLAVYEDDGLYQLYLDFMGDRNLDRHEAKKILKKSPNYEEAYSYWKNSDWRRLAIRLEKHLEQARAFKTLVEELVKIRDFVSTLSPSVSKEEALKLKAVLNESNLNIERSLKGWINLDSAMVSFIDEVMSTLGLASGGINSILLLFMSLFQEALERDDLYLVRIELERTDNDKRDVIPVS